MGKNDSHLIRYSEGTGQNFGKVRNVVKDWRSFSAMFATPTRTAEKFRDYLALGDKDQLALKATDGFIYRTQVEGKKRNRSSGKRSDLISLDFDYATPDFFQKVLRGEVAGHLEWTLHTSRRHTPEKPRFRIWIPLKRPLENDIYDPAARIAALLFDPEFEFVDRVSFRPAQMMFKPTCSKDAEYIHHESHGELLDWQAELDTFELVRGDWRDLSNLPRCAGEMLREVAKKAEDPTTKKGIVGDFCRAYDVPAAIDKFLPDIYEPVDGAWAKPRYTYLKGTTTNGAEVQDNGLFLYSHHGSDPCADRLVNAYDLVRIHLFGHEDAGLSAEELKDLGPGKVPSAKAFAEFIANDEGFREQRMRSRYDVTALYDDAGVDYDEAPDDESDAVAARPESADYEDAEIAEIVGHGTIPPHVVPVPGKRRKRPGKKWVQQLQVDARDGTIVNNLPNLVKILQNDMRVNETMEFDVMTLRVVTRLPLRSRMSYLPVIDLPTGDRMGYWEDIHTHVIRAMLETEPQGESPGWGLRPAIGDLQAAIQIVARQLPLDRAKDALFAQEWRGEHLIELLWIKCFATEDNAYYRETARLFLLAAVARTYEPGHKFDYVPIISGPQGIGKSTFAEVLACGFKRDLTSDLSDVKAVEENLAGAVIAEIAELASLRRSEIESTKAFVTRTETTYRRAFDRTETTVKRRCVFIGTTNRDEYLQDRTGNRRWWPIEAQTNAADLDWLRENVLQLWAEARVVYFQMRQQYPDRSRPLPLFLSKEASAFADALQSETVEWSEVDVFGEQIEAFLLEPAWGDAEQFGQYDPEADPESPNKIVIDGKPYWKAVSFTKVKNVIFGSKLPTKMDLRHLADAFTSIGWGGKQKRRVESAERKDGRELFRQVPMSLTDRLKGSRTYEQVVEAWYRARLPKTHDDTDDLI